MPMWQAGLAEGARELWPEWFSSFPLMNEKVAGLASVSGRSWWRSVRDVIGGWIFSFLRSLNHAGSVKPCARWMEGQRAWLQGKSVGDELAAVT